MTGARLSTRAAPVLLGAGVVLLFFGELLHPARVLVVRDIARFHLPLRLVSSSLARQGVPWWNPMVHGGQPILSNPNYAAFYPPTWLALVLPAHYALSLLVVLHAAWAFAGAWRLARRLGCRTASSAFAAIAFVASGGFVATPNNLTLYCGLAWLPWVLFWGELGLRGAQRAERVRGILLTGAAVAMQLLSGEPYSPTLGALALLCLAFAGGATWPRLAGRLAAMLVVAALLGAVQLAPTLSHLADSPRLEGLSDEQTMTWSTRPGRLVEWLFPHIDGDSSRLERGLFFGQHRHDRGSAYLPSIYAGQLVLILAIAGLVRRGTPRRASWIALIVIGVALALGRHNPLYAEVLVRIPPWSVLRYPEKFLLLATTALPFAAALEWDRVLAGRQRGLARAATLPSIVAVVVLAAAAVFLMLPWVSPELVRSLVAGGEVAVSAETQAARLSYLGFEAIATFAFALGSVALLALHRVRGIRGSLLAALLLGFVLADLYRTGRGWVVTARAVDLFTPPAVLAKAPRPAARIWTDQLFFPDSLPMQLDVDVASSIPIALVPGREQLLPLWANLWGMGYALNEDYDLMLTAPARHALATFRTRTRLVEEGWTDLPMVYLGAWNVCNVARRRAPEALSEEFRQTGIRPERVRLLANPFCLERYRFVESAEVHASLEKATDNAERNGFALASAEFLVLASTSDTGPATRSYAEDARLSAIEESGAAIDLTYTASRPALLVAAVTYDPKWRAEADGASVPIFETAIGQMAMEVPPGTHRVALRYSDRFVWLGAMVSLLTVAGGLGIDRLSRRRNPTPATPRSPPQ